MHGAITEADVDAAGQAQTVAPNQLNREFTVQVPDRVYVGDIIYLPTGEGWLYLAVVLDLCSRAVVGWSDILVWRLGA